MEVLKNGIVTKIDDVFQKEEVYVVNEFAFNVVKFRPQNINKERLEAMIRLGFVATNEQVLKDKLFKLEIEQKINKILNEEEIEKAENNLNYVHSGSKNLGGISFSTTTALLEKILAVMKEEDFKRYLKLL